MLRPQPASETRRAAASAARPSGIQARAGVVDHRHYEEEDREHQQRVFKLNAFIAAPYEVDGRGVRRPSRMRLPQGPSAGTCTRSPAGKPREDSDDDQRGAGDDPRRRRDAPADGVVRVARLCRSARGSGSAGTPGSPSRARRARRRGRAAPTPRSRRAAVNPSRSAPEAVLEDEHEQAVRRADREQVEGDRRRARRRASGTRPSAARATGRARTRRRSAPGRSPSSK